MCASVDEGVDRLWKFQLRREHSALLDQVQVLDKASAMLGSSHAELAEQVQAYLQKFDALRSDMMERIAVLERERAQRDVELVALKQDMQDLRARIAASVGEDGQQIVRSMATSGGDKGTVAHAVDEEAPTLNITSSPPVLTTSCTVPSPAAPEPTPALSRGSAAGKRKRQADDRVGVPLRAYHLRQRVVKPSLTMPAQQHQEQQKVHGAKRSTPLAKRTTNFRRKRDDIGQYRQFGMAFEDYVRILEKSVPRIPAIDQNQLLSAWFKGMDGDFQDEIVAFLTSQESKRLIPVGDDVYKLDFNWAEFKPILVSLGMLSKAG